MKRLLLGVCVFWCYVLLGRSIVFGIPVVDVRISHQYWFASDLVHLIGAALVGLMLAVAWVPGDMWRIRLVALQLAWIVYAAWGDLVESLLVRD